MWLQLIFVTFVFFTGKHYRIIFLHNDTWLGFCNVNQTCAVIRNDIIAKSLYCVSPDPCGLGMRLWLV